MNKSIIVKGKENDVVFRLFENNNSINEIHIQIEGENSWTVIGYKDLQMAIKKAERKFNPKGLKICPQCQRKHNETQFNVFCCAACCNGF